jgi:hypothetical protein
MDCRGGAFALPINSTASFPAPGGLINEFVGIRWGEPVSPRVAFKHNYFTTRGVARWLAEYVHQIPFQNSLLTRFILRGSVA